MKKRDQRTTDHIKFNKLAELWCWKRLLRVPWTARRSNQAVLKEINPDYSLEGLMLMLKLKLQYSGHLIQRADSLEKTVLLGKTDGKRRRGWQRMRWLDGIIDSVDMSWTNSGRWWRIGKPGVLQSMGSQRAGHELVTKQQQCTEDEKVWTWARFGKLFWFTENG